MFLLVFLLVLSLFAFQFGFPYERS